MHGLLFSISGTMSFALGADYIPKRCMGEGVGFLSMGQIVGMAIGPNIGFYLLDRYSYDVCFVLSGVLIIIAGLSVCALRCRNEIQKHHALIKKRSIRFQDFIAIELMPNVFFVSLFMLGNGLVNSFLAMIGATRGITGIGIYFVINAITVLIARPLIGRMTDKKGVAYAILPGYIFAAAAMIVIGNGYSILPIATAAILFALGAGSSMPAIQADCLKRLDRTRSTVATGTYMIGLDIGMTIGPMLGGIIADNYGFTTTFNSAGTLMLLGFGIYLIYTTILKQRITSSNCS
jgi:MFS family permease